MNLDNPPNSHDGIVGRRRRGRRAVVIRVNPKWARCLYCGGFDRLPWPVRPRPYCDCCPF